MKSRPLKVGEYRKVKTWEQLLATDGAKIDREVGIRIESNVFNECMRDCCDRIFLVSRRAERGIDRFEVYGKMNYWVADFFTNDCYNENGNEIKMENEEFKVGDKLYYKDGLSFEITEIDKASHYQVRLKWNTGSNGALSFKDIIDYLTKGVCTRSTKCEQAKTDTLDQLEQQTLTKIAKLREIEAKQVEIDTKIEEQNKRIEEYEKGEL